MEIATAEHIQFDFPLPAKSREEEFVEILERVNTNAKYRCKFCGHTFSGGNQKIRVHITGVKEGGSSVKPCSNPSADAVEYCAQPRTSYKRTMTQDSNKAKSKKPTKQLEASRLASVYTETWTLLHTPGKLREVESGGSSEGAAGSLNSAAIPATSGNTMQLLQHLLDEYGAEKADDLALLDHVHLIKIAGFLKVVPRKIFLDMLGVPQPPVTMSTM